MRGYEESREPSAKPIGRFGLHHSLWWSAGRCGGCDRESATSWLLLTRRREVGRCCL